MRSLRIYGPKLLLAFFMVGTISCSADDAVDPGDGVDPGNAQTGAGEYPKQVELEYKITSSSGLQLASVRYTNESGGDVTVDDVPLPFSAKVPRQVKSGDAVFLSARSSDGGSLTSEILVDGKSVGSKTSTATRDVYTSNDHFFD